jgi:nucleoid DNA-binding protein
MTKEELIKKVSDSAGINKKTAKKVIDILTTEITATLSNGDSIRLQDFGTFQVADRAARVWKNPRTGEVVNLTGGKAPVFHPSHKLKEKVR